jgi:putative ABC transport system ATP-binding protein
MIELKNVTMKYGEMEVLKGVNLSVERGDFLSIVGPSGSGKTTLLNIIAGILTPTEGEVFIDGISIYDLIPKERAKFRRKKFGFVFQTFNLIPYLTVVENVQVPLYLAGVDRRKQRKIAEELLGKVGLLEKLHRFPSELSVGEQQRVAIARALANNPEILLADEPTGNLDSKTGIEIMKFIKGLNGEGVTVLLVTHDSEISKFARKEIKIVDGRLL